MLNKLLASASVLAMGLSLTPAAYADPLTISTTTTTPVKTSAAANNTPGDITTTSTGQVNPTSGVAITVDSNNNVTHGGTITISGANNSAGIQAAAGVTSNIASTGTITVNETYTRTDSNNDGVLDGPYAQGSGRFGIHALGALTGSVTVSGTMTVQGNNSAGIALDGPLSGALSSTGTISVAGDNSYGIAAGNVGGNVTIGGAITAVGTNTVGVALNGNVGGALLVNGAVTTTGYSSATLPASTATLLPGNLLQGGPAFWIAGDVAGGANFAAATSTTTNGTTTTTPAATLISYGSSPALLIGSATRSVTLGSVQSDAGKFGLVLGGSIGANGVYAGFQGTAAQIGGLGNTVTITNGIRVTGTIAGSANAASATGLRLGSGATAPTLVNTGTISGLISAQGTATNLAATGLQIDAGASLPTMVNNGTIGATGVTGATSYGIRDQSGTLTSIQNDGVIQAQSGTTNVAIDVSAATAGVTINQDTSSGGFKIPSIVGDIRYGTGNNNSLTVTAGSVQGNVVFGGANNSFTLGGAAAFSGTTNFNGTAGTLTIGGTSTFTGNLANAQQAAVAINGGTFATSTTGTTTAIGSLAMNGGTLNLSIGANAGTAPIFTVAGNAGFTGANKLQVQFGSLASAQGSFTIVQAGSVTGAQNLALNATGVPFLFNSSLATNANNTAIILTTSRKTAADLGLSSTLAAVYDPAYQAALGDQAIGDTFLTLADSAGVNSTLRTLLPNFAGGTFDDVSLATRAATHLLADRNMQQLEPGKLGAWIQLVGWADKKSIGKTAGYNVYGSGVTVGVERDFGEIGRFGATGSYLIGVANDVGTTAGVSSNEALFTLYWRATWGRLHAYATGGYGTVGFAGTRYFSGTTQGTSFSRTAKGNWGSTVYTGAGGVSYEMPAGRFYLRPEASIDYVRLKEKAYSESGGGTGFNLSVDGRTGTETGVNGSLAVGYYVATAQDAESTYIRVELQGGDRELISSKLGATTARFGGGNDFTLTPEARKSGWTGGMRVAAGNGVFTLTGEVGAEKQQDHVAGTARISVSFHL